MLTWLQLSKGVMSQRTSARTFRRLAIYVLVAALVIGTTVRPATAEADPREQRSDAAMNSSTEAQAHQGPFGVWSSADHTPGANPSFFDSWLTSIYVKLVSLKSAAQDALAYAWTLGHTKPKNTCD